MTFPVCAMYQLFVRSCVLAHHGLYCSHVCACTHHSLMQHLSLVFAFIIFSSHMEKHQNVRPPLSTTEWNHSYYTGKSALHSLQQLQAGTSSTSVQPLASIKESNGTASSGSVSSPQLPHSAIISRVLAGPTRNVTGEVMSTSLAEAVTRLSFREFLQRCNLLIAPPPLPQPQVPTPPLDAATQTLLNSAASRDVSAQPSYSEFLASPSTHDVLCPTCTRTVPSLLLDAAVQTPFHSVAAHDANYRSRSSSSSASSPKTL